VNLAFEPAEDVYRRDAGDTFQTVLHLILQNQAGLHRIEPAGGAEDQDGKRGQVELSQRRPVCFFGQPSCHAIEAIANVVCGGVKVGSPREGHANVALAFDRRGGELFHARHSTHRLLDGAGDQLLDFLGSGVLVRAGDADRRVGNVRHQVDGKTQQRNPAQYDHDQNDHDREDGPMDRELRDLHRVPPCRTEPEPSAEPGGADSCSVPTVLCCGSVTRDPFSSR